MGPTRKTDNYNSAFAEKLRDLISEKAISMTQLGKELGVKQQTVSQWADGKTTPALNHLKPLASYFEVTIDELVTGVAPENEAMHLDTGLSNLTIEKLKQLKTDDVTDDMDDMDYDDRGFYDKSKSKIIIEFLNIIIENIYSNDHNLSRFAESCMNYIVGAHGPILMQEEYKREKQEGIVLIGHIDRPNFQNDDLDFKTYQLTKDFEYFIVDLTKNREIARRARAIYKKANLHLPDYSDSRYKPEAMFSQYYQENPHIIEVDIEHGENKDD